jgi:cell division septal protein FtsQ
LANRKTKARRKRGERRPLRRKFTLYYLIALFFAAALAIGLSLTAFFKITNIEVQIESSRYSAEEIVEASGIKAGDNLIRVATKKASQAIVDAFPYVAEVNISRQFPESVLIRVELTEPAEALAAEEGYVLVDPRGRILEIGLPLRPNNYPQVFGVQSIEQLAAGDYLPEQSQKAYDLLRQITAEIEKESFDGIDVIDLRDLLNLRLLYRGRIVIELGSRLEIEYKIRLAKAALDSEEEKEFVGVLDASTRPMARLRAGNIYEADTWPFPASILEEYERKIQTQNVLT